MSHAKLINLRFNNFFKHPSGTEDQSVCFVLSLFLLFDRKNSEQVTENFFRKSLQKRAQRITKTSLNVDKIIYFFLCFYCTDCVSLFRYRLEEDGCCTCGRQAHSDPPTRSGTLSNSIVHQG